MFTDGSRLEHGATGHAVTWKGHKTHMGWGQEAYDAECAAIVRALRVAATKNRTLGTVTIFTGARGCRSWRASPVPGLRPLFLREVPLEVGEGSR